MAGGGGSQPWSREGPRALSPSSVELEPDGKLMFDLPSDLCLRLVAGACANSGGRGLKGRRPGTW